VTPSAGDYFHIMPTWRYRSESKSKATIHVKSGVTSRKWLNFLVGMCATAGVLYVFQPQYHLDHAATMLLQTTTQDLAILPSTTTTTKTTTSTTTTTATEAAAAAAADDDEKPVDDAVINTDKTSTKPLPELPEKREFLGELLEKEGFRIGAEIGVQDNGG